MIITPKQSIIMFDFIHAKSNRLKIIKSTRRRFPSHQYQWRRPENIRRWIILLKLIYAIIFLCLTISSCLNQSIDNNIEYSKTIFIRILDLWFAFLGLILILSLFVDRLKRHNLMPLRIINVIEVLLMIGFIIFVIIGHIQGYYHLWWSSSIELIRSTLLSIIFLDICPISIAIVITINSLKKRRSCRRVHANTMISSV